MKIICPITYAKNRVAERGYDNFRMVYRDLQLRPRQTKIIKAYNELWFILEVDRRIRVSSDYGIYDDVDKQLSEQIHEHADRIEILNRANSIQRITCLQIIMALKQ